MHILHVLIHIASLLTCLCIIDTSMPKKTRPITVLTAEELDALDDATFAELAADEERLHQALEDPTTIRSGQALSIAKTKPRRQTVSRQRTLDEALAHDSMTSQIKTQSHLASTERSFQATRPQWSPLEEQLTRTTRPPRWMKI